MEHALGVSIDELIYEKSVKDVNWNLESNGPRTLHILHFNDVYNLDPETEEEPVGGASRFASLMDYLQRKLLAAYGCHPLILFSGDFMGPSLMSSFTKGGHMIDMLNILNVHCATFGNHELDYGYDRLKEIISGKDTLYPASDTQWVMTNVNESGTGHQFGGEKTHKTLLFDWNGSGSAHEKRSIRVGILAVSENWLNCSTVNVDEFIYSNFIESARENARRLRSSGAEIVIALTHSRLENDKKLADAVKEIDLILGGHDHFYKNELETYRLLKSGEEWRWISHVKIDTDKKITCQQYETRSRIPPSPRVEVLCELYRTQCEKRYGDVIFRTAVDMDSREECVRFRESTLANWMCDACVFYHNEIWGTVQKIDAALLPAFCFGGKRIVHAGDFTMGDLIKVCPKSIEFTVLRVSGDVLKAILAEGVSKLPNECPLLMHVSSVVKYEVDGKSGIGNVTVNGAGIDSREFHIMVPSSLTLPCRPEDYEVVIRGEDMKPLADTVKLYCQAFHFLFNAINVSSGDVDSKIRGFIDKNRSNLEKFRHHYPANPTTGRILLQESHVIRKQQLNT